MFASAQRWPEPESLRWKLPHPSGLQGLKRLARSSLSLANLLCP